MEETSQEHFTRLLLIRHGQTRHNITGVISGHSAMYPSTKTGTNRRSSWQNG